MNVVTAKQMAALDRRTIEVLKVPGTVLMERASLGCADLVAERAGSARSLVVLAGPGNNGGDGIAVARILHLRGWDAKIYLPRPESDLSDDAALQLEIARGVGVDVASEDPATLDRWLRRHDVWVDALLGTGLSGAPRGAIGDVIATACSIRGERATKPVVVAVDIPSGVNGSTGAVEGDALPADATATFAHSKWGHYLPPGGSLRGELRVIDIGVPREWAAIDSSHGTVVDAECVQGLYSRPRDDQHKNVAGHILAIAGSDEMPGAASLCTTAAIRSGAGLVSLVASSSVRAIAVGRTPEIMGVAELPTNREAARRYDAFLFGPGKGRGPEIVAELRLVGSMLAGRPLVVDADGLHALTSLSRDMIDGPLLLTPHVGELAALLGEPKDDVMADLPSATRRCAERYDALVVAKTAGAVIDTGRSWLVPGMVPGLATAGSGDVLTGITAALAARLTPARAAVVAPWIHNRAGRLAEQRLGPEAMTATDIIDHLGEAFRAVTGADE